jgi:uncharacterized protein (DUF302 family)
MPLRVTNSSAPHDVTVQKLVDAIERRGIKIFARIDHAAAARDVGLELDPEQVIVFGNPRAGTQLMVDDPRVGLDLPLRILVYERGGEVTLAYHDPRELSGRQEILDAMAGLMAEIVAEATG